MIRIQTRLYPFIFAMRNLSKSFLNCRIFFMYICRRSQIISSPMVFIAIILLMGTSGCSSSPHQLSLNEILSRHDIDSVKSYTYRCTAGAHRGASVDHRENTMAALINANRLSKYGFIEFDVQYSADKIIVIYHDQRMLRQFGSIRSVGETNYARLKEISEGEIIAYADVIDRLGKKLNIEIKSQGDEAEDRHLADEIIADLKARKRLDDVLISSISKDLVRYINDRHPTVETGQIFWVTPSTYLPFDTLTQKLYETIDTVQADYLMLHVANLRNIDDLLKLKPSDMTLVFWDFDDNIYILHADLADRLWGDSFLKAFFRSWHFKLARFFRD